MRSSIHRSALALLALSLVRCAGGDPAPIPPPAPSSVAPPAASAATPVASAAARAPTAARRPVVDELHGEKITDDYRWLEDGNDPEVKAWSAAQNLAARAHLDALPGRKAIADQAAALISSRSPDHTSLNFTGGQLFAMKQQPPKQQAFLVTLKSADDAASERVVVDPNTLDAGGGLAIDFYVPSRDGKKVAVSLSKHGSESGDVHVYDVATGKETGDVIHRVNGGTAGGSVAWNSDGSGFYYTRYPREGERAAADVDFYQQVFFHKLGADEKSDVYSLGKDFPRIAEIELHGSDDGKYILARMSNGDGGEHAHWLIGPAGKWEQIARIEDQVTDAAFGGDGKLYLLSLQGSPRGRILRVAPGKPALAKAELVVPESPAVIQTFSAGKTQLYVVDLVGGPSQIRSFDIKAAGAGKALGAVPILPISSVREIARLPGDDFMFRNQSYLEPPAWYRYAGGKSARTQLFQTSAASFADVEAVREMCTSRDGTKVPINIIRKKGIKLDGNNPTLLTGYGGYGVSVTPGFDVVRRLWLDHGGVYAVANLRGGGELGEDWHTAGKLTKKQNVFDDLHACGKHLAETGVTRPEKLGILGSSNGGLLMGAELTQHPEAWKAVVARVGIYDSLRFELTANGAFNITELGTVKDPEQFKALHAYSPYHHVKDGASYPAVLFLTGENDPRVDPYNSRKMTARLQAANASKAPILLRTSGDTGHGMGSPLSAMIAEAVDIWSFLITELGG